MVLRKGANKISGVNGESQIKFHIRMIEFRRQLSKLLFTC